MNQIAYVLDEFLQKTGIDKSTLELWEKLKLLKPVGFTEDKIPFYSHATLEQVAHIKKLVELGYGPEEIQKIIRKIGLPHKSEEAKKDKSTNFLTVGTLAEKVQVSPRTIKHWEDKGIIDADMRSEGGFRMYSEHYIYLCQLIQDLQLFGYSLDEIKTISDYFRDFIKLQSNIESASAEETAQKLQAMSHEIALLLEKTNQLKAGIQRWEDLLKKKKKELTALKSQNQKRFSGKEGKNHEKDDLH
ncbi:MAG TPA: MerR family transcriptional regulator [bacterium]|nr:MerR family transcriptional regulator [bacterium]HPN44370.1 MerR family transcriptional regulator [bacterium]